jgi:hypothetical protein
VTRTIGLTLFTSALMAAFLVAADDPAPEKGDKEPAKKEAKAEPDAKGENPAVPEAPQEKAEEIIRRLNEEFETSRDRLDKKDPGAETRDIQKKIIDDLDKLINQQNNSDCSCKNPSSSSSSTSKSSSSSSSSSSSAGKGNQSDKSQASSQPKKGGQGEKKDQSAGKGKDGQKDEKKQDAAGKHGGEKKDQTAKNDGKDKDGKKEGGTKGGDSDKGRSEKKDNNTVADLYKDVWGHLPQWKRLEMDVHARERFMPKYEDLLRQYYRTIAEQGKRRDGE